VGNFSEEATLPEGDGGRVQKNKKQKGCSFETAFRIISDSSWYLFL
jgi:hypothetical protein